MSTAPTVTCCCGERIDSEYFVPVCFHRRFLVAWQKQNGFFQPCYFVSHNDYDNHLMFRQNYPAKVLLFGEHTVLRGGQALAVPNPAFGLQWTLKRNAEPDPRLTDLLRFLKNQEFGQFLQLGLLEKDIRKGWRLAGNVPHGYGLGSSGVVCAAIWHRYGKRKARSLELADLRSSLAEMEGFYHGSSSGTDPLISYLDHPALLSERGLNLIELPGDWAKGFFLLDTRLPRKSSPLIRYFTARFDSDADWRRRVKNGWMSFADHCIAALVADDRVSLRQNFNHLSELQMEEVPNFIPPSVQPIWRGNCHRLKLCGAGGGGFMLGHTENWETTLSELKDWKITPLS